MEPFDEDYSFGYAPILVSVGGASLISLISRDEKEEGGLVATLFRAFHQHEHRAFPLIQQLGLFQLPKKRKFSVESSSHGQKGFSKLGTGVAHQQVNKFLETVPLSLRIAIVEMSLLRSEAGFNCFIRSSAGLRLEAAEREEKERWC